ncbi:hypothetical protein PVAND_008698 [Polypedilum vanderplanki]|uniref:Uncharacterized protein n=1 Tax=Polypedilum vanderplanki TaxID=319348 RepID=A0A9J6CAE1_POLVA|nr:hypothetical protein PVAND_008698 [Polypedilum vanderplanki]
MKLSDRVTIEKAEEQHLEEKSYDDFDAFEIVFALNLKFLPKNINNIFKNLAQIEITHSSLTEITSEDLKFFPELKDLVLNLNQVKVIRENTFIFSPKLEEITLMYNKINHIDPKSFSDLKSLEKLGLKENICEFGYAFNRNEVLEVIKNIEQGFCL